MIYLSGVVNGKYLKNEMKQLDMYLSHAKVRKRIKRELAFGDTVMNLSNW